MTIPQYGLHYIPRGNIGLVGMSGKAEILKMVGTGTEIEAGTEVETESES